MFNFLRRYFLYYVVLTALFAFILISPFGDTLLALNNIKAWESINKNILSKIIQNKEWVDSNSVGDNSLEKVQIKINDIEDLDGQIEDYLRDLYPIISDKTIEQIENTKFLDKKLINDTLGIVEFYLNFFIPKYYLEDHIYFLWELNIAAFQSRLYQIYNQDTISIDTWPNVVGKPSTKTYTGHYQVFRLRNWPFWKDPESPDSVRPTPPGPNNPLGLFVAHYDENSLRYFHGTNKNYLLKSENRALSHGCVRNKNENIAKMKEFIIKKLIKSDDLSSWLGSKKSMTYEIKEQDRFPVRIIYKTFDIDYDVYGYYIIFYRDVYNYEKNFNLSEYDDPNLITLANTENIIKELKEKNLSNKYNSEKIIPIIENLIASHNDYQKYYFDDLLAERSNN